MSWGRSKFRIGRNPRTSPPIESTKEKEETLDEILGLRDET